MWRGTEGVCRGHGGGHGGSAERGTEGAWKGHGGHRGGMEGMQRGHGRGVEGVQRGHGGGTEGWLSLATINLVVDNREFEV